MCLACTEGPCFFIAEWEESSGTTGDKQTSRYKMLQRIFLFFFFLDGKPDAQKGM